MGPRICYIAPFTHDYGTEFHLARDAEAIGCEVQRVPERDGRFVFDDPPECDLLLYTRGTGIPGVDKIGPFFGNAAKKIPTASFSLDLYRGLVRASEVGHNSFWTTGTALTADGGSEEWFACRGVHHHWLPPACVSDECVKVEWRLGLQDALGYEPEIVFVGSSRSYHREWSWRADMIVGLRHRYGKRFATLGPQDGYTIRGFDLNALYQREGMIVIGDSLSLPGHRDYFSDRYWETIGRGGFLIGPRAPGIDAFFTEGEHFVGYDQGDLADLFDQIDDWLDSPEKAREIADAGQEHVRATATYQHRVRHMLDVLGVA